MSGLGIFAVLFGVVTSWSGWHNYSVLQVLTATLKGQQVSTSGNHAGGQGIHNLVSFDWGNLFSGIWQSSPLGGLAGALGGAGGPIANLPAPGGGQVGPGISGSAPFVP